MILGLYIFLIGISLVLIALGIFRHNESGYALIGFSLFFILSILLMNGGLEVEKGSNVTTVYSYDDSGNINGTDQDILYSYNIWDDSTSQQIGFWLSVASAFGFIWLLYSVKRGDKDD